MKSKITRTISVALAAIIAATAMTGCKEKAEVTEFDDNGVYTPSSDLALTVWETQGTDYAPKSMVEGDIVAEWLKNKTKVVVENMYGNDGGQWDPKLTKLVAGDNLPDIVHCGGSQGPAHFTKLKQLGKLYELTPEILQKYAPEVWRKTPQKYWDAMTVDGKILGIPYGNGIKRECFPDMDDETYEFVENNMQLFATDVTFQNDTTLWIRDDILKKFYPNARTYEELVALMKEKNEPLGDELLDVPIYTTQEFIDFMYNIKNANITQEGKKVYALGYNGGDNWTALTWVGADMYGYKNHKYTSTWNSVKQEIEVPLVHDIVRKAARTQNQMIADSVIDQESLAHTVALFKEKIFNGQYAIVSLSGVIAADELNKELERTGKTFRYRPFITQVPNLEEYSAFKQDSLWTDSIAILNTLSESEMHQVLNWINTQYTDEYEQVYFWGPKEAGLYVETEDGKYKFKDEKFNQYFIEGDKTAIPNEKDRLGLSGSVSMLHVRPTGANSKWNPVIMWRKIVLSPTTRSGFRFTSSSEHTKNVKVYPMCQVWDSVYADIPEVVTYWAAREQWEAKFKIALASAPSEFEKKWDEAIEELNKIVDVAAMEKAMTEVAKPLAAQIAE